ncbi:hypothetical protein BESB_010100 [Besnoitia besnoiti]|uniref:Uncharacterized protein n=1 Tax=Besnoitia besnoiti TaxID=94643 RepID=A0A2A9MJE7_BESBE|nr:hypothetical protein BESB_010100 [Besnoitia besnoiti]PFH38668.1 hypothetical protein BESB_010100 [Besnoitia besnoiti]
MANVETTPEIPSVGAVPALVVSETVPAAAAEAKSPTSQAPAAVVETIMTDGTPYRAVGTGENTDPIAVQVAAIRQQQEMYGGFGSPYALNTPAMGLRSQPYPGMGGQTPLIQLPSAPGAIPLTASFYNAPTSLPGPCYYDPYGMLNPAACFSPMPIAAEDPAAQQKSLATPPARKARRWCC